MIIAGFIKKILQYVLKTGQKRSRNFLYTLKDSDSAKLLYIIPQPRFSLTALTTILIKVKKM